MQVSKVEKTCSNPACGKTYQVARHRADGSRFCSVPCMDAAKVVYPPKKCSSPTCTNLVKGNRKWCSQDCYHTTTAGQPRTKRVDAGVLRSGWVERACDCGCGVMVRRRESEMRVSMFASRECFQRSDRIRRGTGRPKTVELGRRWVNTDGYVMVQVGKDGLHAYGGGGALEHRVVMAGMIGRPLLSSENVHHVNGKKTDNRPENLELWVSKQPKGQRVEDIVAYAKEMLALYEPSALR